MSDQPITNSFRRVVIRGPPSWGSRCMWWIVKFAISYVAGKPPIAVKGAQQWTLPPPTLKKELSSGELVLNEWKETSTGWTIPILSPKRPIARKRAALYFHGGAYIGGLNSGNWTWTSYLCRSLDADIYLIPYPLAPTNTAAEVMPALTSLYGSFLQKVTGQETLIIGDSAGGVIAIGLAFSAHQSNLPLPDQVIAISPGVDLSMNRHLEAVAKLKPLDPMLDPDSSRRSRRMWAGVSPDGPEPIPEEILNNPAINPILGDLSTFREAGTKLIVASGTFDTMHPAIEELIENAQKKGVETVYIEGEQQIHVFPMMRDYIREANEAATAIVDAVLSFSRP